MRYLIGFMVIAGLFIFGGKSCSGGDWSFGFGVKGEGPVQTENRTVSDFHAVSTSVSGKVEIRVADRFSVEVQAQENILPILKTEVENGKLRIYFDENVSRAKDLVVRVTAPAYDAFEIGGSGHIETFDPIQSDRLDLSIAGSGEIVLSDAQVNEMRCDIAGSGDIMVRGRSTDAQFNISGSGDVNAKDLVAEHAKASIAGSGKVTCHANQTLKAGVSGSGDIYYKGSASVDSDVSGSGKIKRIDD